jgi:hypothetical protein
MAADHAHSLRGGLCYGGSPSAVLVRRGRATTCQRHTCQDHRYAAQHHGCDVLAEDQDAERDGGVSGPEVARDRERDS